MRRRRPLPKAAHVHGAAAVPAPMRPAHRRDRPLGRRAGARALLAMRRPCAAHVDRLPWSVRLGGWALAAIPLAFVWTRPWLALAGPAVFEAAWFAFQALRRRRLPGGIGPSGREGPDDPDAGVREPRRPSPLAGAGAVALSEPEP